MITASSSIRALIPRVSDSAHLHRGACSALARRKKKTQKNPRLLAAAAASGWRRRQSGGAPERGIRQQEEEIEQRAEGCEERGKRERGDKFGRQRERGKADKERWRTARAVAHCAADRQRDRPDRGNECSY